MAPRPSECPRNTLYLDQLQTYLPVPGQSSQRTLADVLPAFFRSHTFTLWLDNHLGARVLQPEIKALLEKEGDGGVQIRSLEILAFSKTQGVDVPFRLRVDTRPNLGVVIVQLVRCMAGAEVSIWTEGIRSMLEYSIHGMMLRRPTWSMGLAELEEVMNVMRNAGCVRVPDGI